jgi:hypothetical protein
MIEQGHNSLPEGEYQQDKRVDDGFIPEDAWPLCPNCLTPCHPLQYYCPNCNSNQAINPLTPYIGFVNIRFNYDIFLTMWRKIWYDKDVSITSRLFYLFMTTMQVPVLLVIGLPLLLIYKVYRTRFRRITIIALFIIAILLFILFLRYKLFTGFVSRPIRR